jgi:hypothetical protein
MLAQRTAAEIYELTGDMYQAARQATAKQGVAFAENLTVLRRNLETCVRQALEDEPNSAACLAQAIAEAASRASDGLVAPVASTDDDWEKSDAGIFVLAAHRGSAAVGRGEALAVFSLNRVAIALTEAMRVSSLTTYEMASKLGINLDVLIGWIEGRSAPSLNDVSRFESVFGRRLQLMNQHVAVIDRVVVEIHASGDEGPRVLPPAQHDDEVATSIKTALTAACDLAKAHDFAPAPTAHTDVDVYIGGYPWPFVPPSSAHADITELPIEGPSLALPVALAWLSAQGMLGEAEARSIVTTGELTREGRVAPVGDGDIKAHASRVAERRLAFPRSGRPMNGAPGSAPVDTLFDAVKMIASPKTSVFHTQRRSDAHNASARAVLAEHRPHMREIIGDLLAWLRLASRATRPEPSAEPAASDGSVDEMIEDALPASARVTLTDALDRADLAETAWRTTPRYAFRGCVSLSTTVAAIIEATTVSLSSESCVLPRAVAVESLALDNLEVLPPALGSSYPRLRPRQQAYGAPPASSRSIVYGLVALEWDLLNHLATPEARDALFLACAAAPWRLREGMPEQVFAHDDRYLHSAIAAIRNIAAELCPPEAEDIAVERGYLTALLVQALGALAYIDASGRPTALDFAALLAQRLETGSAAVRFSDPRLPVSSADTSARRASDGVITLDAAGGRKAHVSTRDLGTLQLRRRAAELTLTLANAGPDAYVALSVAVPGAPFTEARLDVQIFARGSDSTGATALSIGRGSAEVLDKRQSQAVPVGITGASWHVSVALTAESPTAGATADIHILTDRGQFIPFITLPLAREVLTGGVVLTANDCTLTISRLQTAVLPS